MNFPVIRKKPLWSQKGWRRNELAVNVIAKQGQPASGTGGSTRRSPYRFPMHYMCISSLPREVLSSKRPGRSIPAMRLEGTFQWGSFGSGDIQAWRIALDIGYHLSSLPLRPRPHLQIDVMSGDRRQGDQNIESFNPLFPKAHYFGLIGLLGPVNLINTHPSIDFQLTEKLRATTKIDFFWRQNINDGVYNPAGALLQAAGNSKATYVGSEAQVEIYWEINRHLALISNYSHFFVGQFLRETGPGKDVDYTTTWVTFRF